MSRSELHDWEYAIESLCGDNAGKMLAIVQDIYNTAFARGKNQSESDRTRWIPVSERMPEEHGDYLVTIENGDVFNCYFNPDYCYDGYDNGAFTYTKEYFNHETMGSLGSEEFVVDGVVAWMPYEPYKAESEG